MSVSLTSALKWGRTLLAVLVSSLLPLLLLAIWVDIDSVGPVALLFIYGTPFSLALVCVSFVPFHIFLARRGRPQLLHYVIWGALVTGGLFATAVLIISEGGDHSELVWQVIIFALFAGTLGGAVFHMIALGRTPPAEKNT